MSGSAGPIDAPLAQLRALAREGGEIRRRLDAAADADERSLAAARVWQRDCAAVVSQLSGGSKAHWLSRAYSAALLVRADDGQAVGQASVADIVTRVLDVLDRAAQALMHGQPDPMAAASAEGAPVPRFDFVRHAPLRPVLEQAYRESGSALDAGDYMQSLMTTSSMLEALLTDALQGGGEVAELSFAERIEAAERRGLIRGGCARLPQAARDYRDLPRTAIVTAREARVARQVLHVVMRDLDPGR